MRLPTIGVVVTSGLDAARRFPIVVATGVVAASAAIALIDSADDTSESSRLLVVATLGLPLLFALSVLAGRRAGGAAARWLPLAGGVVLAAVWAAWPRWSPPVQRLRYAQLSVAFHLLVAFLPFAGHYEPNGFWQYNKALLLRFLAASLYSAVLYGGLAIALLALDKLLGVPVPGEGYARLWVVIAFVFNTWFFVAGVPTDFAALETRADYPEGLRRFTQYVLVPIVAIYLLILTVYLGKVVITRQWPSGWIGYLVSSVASVGILSWLLVHPLEDRAEYAWVKTFTRGFYLGLLPAIVMLWLAIWKRITQYGITEPRYFLTLLSLWLAGIAVYYTVTRSRNIIVIPATLCLLALISFTGPWSAYSVSRISQMRRLRALLIRNDLLVNGMLHRATGVVPPADRAEISAGLRYLLTTHGQGPIAGWLSDSLKRRLAIYGPYAQWSGWSGNPAARAILTSLGVEYVPEGGGTSGQFFRYSTTPAAPPVFIGGYTYAMRVSNWSLRDSLTITDGTYLKLAPDSMGLAVVRHGALLVAISLQPMVDSAAAYRRLHTDRSVPPAVLQVTTRRGGAAAFAYFTQVAGVARQGATRLTSFEGELFLRLP